MLFDRILGRAASRERLAAQLRAQEEAAPPKVAKASERQRQFVVTWSGLAMDADLSYQEWAPFRYFRVGHVRDETFEIVHQNTEVREVGGSVMDWSLVPNATLTQALYGKNAPPVDRGWRTSLWLGHKASGNTEMDSTFLTDIPYGVTLEVRIPVPVGCFLHVLHVHEQMQCVVSGGPNGLPLALGHVSVGLTVD